MEQENLIPSAAVPRLIELARVHISELISFRDQAHRDRIQQEVVLTTKAVRDTVERSQK